jgi:hypothetical protein
MIWHMLLGAAALLAATLGLVAAERVVFREVNRRAFRHLGGRR